MDRTRILTASDKGLPSWAAGLTTQEFLRRAPRLSECWTPLLVVDDGALDGNIRFLVEWTSGHGLELMPHGKTTMAPVLWRRQLNAGATGITVATPRQLRVAREAGIPEVMLAGQLADPGALAWLGRDLARGGRVRVWIDDDAAIGLAEQARYTWPGRMRLDVLIDLGRTGGRTGVRHTADAVRLAERIAASPALRLTGVAGYEGAIAHDRSPAALDGIASYVDELLELHKRLRPLYEIDPADVVVTAGGSSFPDVVARRFAPAAAADPGRFVLRCGASVVHDTGFYRRMSPFEAGGLRAATRGIARVVSAPEPGLVIVDAGKRDIPYDEGLPVPLFTLAADGRRWDLPHARVSAVNDQHSFVELADDLSPAVGDLVVLGLSHPCTMFDKWRLVPVVDSTEDLRSAVVIDLFETLF